MIPTETEHEKVFDLGEGLELWKVNVDSMKEQDKNARIMGKEKFKRLQENIAKDKRLESLPLCYWNDKLNRLEIISGHHRTRAARAAGVVEIFSLVDVTGLSRSQVVSKQLAHNALEGEDDKQVLKEMFDMIDDIEEKFASGINPKEIGGYTSLHEAKLDSINFKYDFQCMQLLFLPTNLAKIKESFDWIESEFECVADMKVFAPFIKTMRKVGEREDIRNASAILLKMCEMVKEYYAAVAPEADSTPDSDAKK